jgi:selenophosphate synthetase-related protein
MPASSGVSEPLSEIVASVLANPGLRAKAVIGPMLDVGAVDQTATDWVSGPGDDGAVLDAGGSNVVVCGEAIFPPFVAADPHGAGFAAVLTNVNDLAAMGAVPLGIVDTVTGPEPLARSAVAGMREACTLFDVPLVGGHLTVHDGPPSVSAFGVGHASAPLSVTRAAPGQSLVVAAALEGERRTDFPFFPAFRARGARCAGDVRLMAGLAGEGVCVAAKDISMAGLIGSLAMLLECAGLGITVDLDAVPRPAGVPMTWWLNCFPSFAFLLCVPVGREAECLSAFVQRDLAAAVVGTFDGSGVLSVSAGGATLSVLDVAVTRVTGLPGLGRPR